MPLYEYQCTECEATLEAIQAFSAPPLEECPECGRSSLKKLLSAPAFQFKGSGWYVNDYARNAHGNGDSKSNGDTDSGKAATSETSSDQSKKASDSTSSSSKSETSNSAAAS